MALFLFVDAALKDKTIDVFNYGKMKRDFTYVDDIVRASSSASTTLLSQIQIGTQSTQTLPPQKPPFKVYNIGNNSPVELMDYIKAVEIKIGREIKKNFSHFKQATCQRHLQT